MPMTATLIVRSVLTKTSARCPTIQKDSVEIIREVRANPFNEGIILAGLEWSLRPLEMITLAEEAVADGLKVMIYTGLTFDAFFDMVGKTCAESTGNAVQIDNNIVHDSDKGIYTFIGSTVMDYLVGNYFLKCGVYDANDKATDYTMFGVKLASNNQKIYSFVKLKETENEEGITKPDGIGIAHGGNREARRKAKKKV